MISVDFDLYYAAHRFGLVARAGGRLMRPKRIALDGSPQLTAGGERATVKEFATLDATVIARSVEAAGSRECWLRADLAGAAAAAMRREAAEHRRVVEVVGRFIADTDAAGAERDGVTVEQYRARRHAAGNRWDRYRAQQRAGGM
jgi:hypothetical protein